MFKKIIIYILGVIFVAIAVAINVIVGFGCTPTDTILYNLSAITKIQFSILLLIFSCFYCLLYYFTFKDKKFSVIALLTSIVFSSIIEIFLRLFKMLDIVSYHMDILFFITSFLLLCFGIALVIYSKIAMLPFEALVKTIAFKVKKNMNFVRTLIEIVFTIIATILALIFLEDLGAVSGVTIFFMLFTGFGVEMCLKLISRKKES